MFADLSIDFLPVLPGWLILGITAGLLVALAHGSRVLRRKGVPARWVAILGSLRLAAVIVFLLALLQPVLSFTRQVEQLPELIVLVDTSESMGLSGGSGRGSRLREVLPALRDGDLADALRRRYQLHWFTFDKSASPLAEEDLENLRATGPTTRYAASLEAAWRQRRAGGGSAERVLLVSDGHDHGKSDPAAAARRLGLVIDTLAPVNDASPKRVAPVEIAGVQSAPRVLLGSETHFRVTLRRAGSGRSSQPLTLRLSENGKHVRAQKVSFPPGRTELTVPLAYRPAAAGVKQYAFHLGGGKPYRLSVRVVDGKHEVLILEDSWRWEFKYLRRVFEDDPSFRFTAVLARGSGAFVQFGSADRRVNLVGFPQSGAELEGFDTIVLGDVKPDRWPSGLARALARLVTEEGKSLVVIPGPNLGRLAAVPALNRLLPVVVAPRTARPLGGPVKVRISTEGAASPFFFWPASAGPARLPALDQIYPPLRKRPAATVLLEAAVARNAYGPLIVAAEHTAGKGRVLYVGTDTLWKWQTLTEPDAEGNTPYRRFWQQAFRALAPTRPNQPGVRLWLQADRSRSEVGQQVRLRAEVEAPRPLRRPEVRGTVTLPGGRELPMAFTVDPERPNWFRAEFEASVPGTHRIKAQVKSVSDASQKRPPAAEAATEIQVAPARSERHDTGIDRANLARLAAATGGRLVDPRNPQSWPPADERSRPPVVQTKALDLWNNYTLVLILCLLLGTDWVLRLLRGYV
jgi:hypothetical protein